MRVTEMKRHGSNQKEKDNLKGEDVEQVQLSYTADGNVNWCHHFGKLLDIIY